MVMTLDDDLQLFDEIAACLADDALSYPLLELDDLTQHEDTAREATVADAQALAPTKPRVKRSRNFARERMQSELRELRVQSAELEQQFADLKAQRAMSQPEQLLFASWHRAAQEQRSLRVRAEMENLRLRQRLRLHTAFANDMQQRTRAFVEARGDSLEDTHSTSSYNSASRAISGCFEMSGRVLVREDLDAHDASMIEALLGELDAAYARMESVFQENGLRAWQADAFVSESGARRTQVQMKSRRSIASPEGSPYIEFQRSSMENFTKDTVVQAACKGWDQVFAASSSAVYFDLDQSGECMGLKEEHTRNVDGEDIVLKLLGVCKVFTDGDDRTTIVWRTVSGETPRFPGVYLSETGWEEFSNAGSTADSSFHLMCSHLETNKFCFGAAAAATTPSALTNLFAASYEADMEQTSALMAGLLLDEPGAAVPTASV